MTVILMLGTLILFLTTDHFVQKAREALARRNALAVVPEGVAHTILPDGVALAQNHTWVRDEGRGVLTIGLDEFVAKLIGTVGEIILPQSGDLIAPSSSTITFRDGERHLDVSAPVRGRVVAVNSVVLRNPGLAHVDPYGDGWLVKIRAERAWNRAVHMRKGGEAIEWLRAQAEEVKAFLLNRTMVPATLQDGGSPVEGVLKSLDSETWREFQQTFVTCAAEGAGVEKQPW